LAKSSKSRAGGKATKGQRSVIRNEGVPSGALPRSTVYWTDSVSENNCLA